MIKHINKWNSNLGKLRWKKPYFMKIPIDLPSFPSPTCSLPATAWGRLAGGRAGLARR